MHRTHQGITTSLLGYPEDARLLLINADDFGMYDAINAAVLRAYSQGVVRSTSLMTPCPGASAAMEILRAHPDLRFGVHLSVIRDIPTYSWGPLAPRQQVPSLLTDDGELFTTDHMDAFLARAEVAELEREFRAQIEVVLSAGLFPTHLDWHCLLDGGRPDIFALTLRLAQEYGLAVRVDGQQFMARMQGLGLPTADHPLLDSFTLPIATKAASYAGLLHTLPAGLTEWAVHPGRDTAAARALDPGGWQVRETDLDFLVSAEAREIIAQEGIILLSYAPLQAVWRRPA